MYMIVTQAFYSVESLSRGPFACFSFKRVDGLFKTYLRLTGSLVLTAFLTKWLIFIYTIYTYILCLWDQRRGWRWLFIISLQVVELHFIFIKKDLKRLARVGWREGSKQKANNKTKHTHTQQTNSSLKKSFSKT